MHLTEGTDIGRYHILEKLGEGGMAVVYKAYDTQLERDVALKVLQSTQGTNEKFIKRFKLEAKALAKLNHPNIVKILDYGEQDGLPYLVMEYVSGKTLKHLVGKPMNYRQAAGLLAPIADALAYAHEHKILHRDVKPSNILIREDGTPLLSDFGIAKILELDETLDLTGTGIGMGTPEYMAPEVGLNKSIDQQIDIYSLGVVMFELVTGRKPYQADTPLAVLLKSTNDPLPRPKEYVKDLPANVESVILKALAKKPENRFHNMIAFAGILEKIAHEGMVSVGKVIGKPYKSGQHLLILITVLISLSLLVIGMLTILKPSLKGQQGIIQTSPLTATTISTMILSPEIKITQTSVLTSQTQKMEYEGQLIFESSRDGNYEIYLINADGTGVKNLTSNSFHDKNPSWSPDGNHIVFDSNRDGDFQIYVMNSDGSELTRLTSSGVNTTPSWSPDGSRIAFASYRDGGYMSLYVMNADGTNQRKLTDNLSDHWQPAWSPDSQYIAFSSNSPSPGDNPYSIYIIHVDGSDITQVTTDVHKNDSSPDWSPDGHWIAFSRSIGPNRDDLMLVNPFDPTFKLISFIEAANICPSWSSNGKWLAFSSNQDGNFELYLMRADGSGQLRITNNSADDMCPVWRPMT